MCFYDIAYMICWDINSSKTKNCVALTRTLKRICVILSNDGNRKKNIIVSWTFKLAIRILVILTLRNIINIRLIGNICFLDFFICDACQHYLYFVFVYPNMLTMQHVIIVDAVYIMFTFPLWEPLKGNACIIILYIQLAYIYHSNICWISSFSNTCVICTCRIIFVDFCECVSHQIS